MEDACLPPKWRRNGGLLRSGGAIWWRGCHDVGRDLWTGRRGHHWSSLPETTRQRYIDDILRPTVILFLQQQPRGVIYQHDNARHHTVRILQNFLGANVNVLPWPDMFSIEHLWDVVDRRVQQHSYSPANHQELNQAL